MKPMAVVQIKASDLTGEKGEEDEFGRLIVRRHPALGRAVELDVRPADVAGVKTVGDIVHLEYFEPGSGTAKELVVKRQDFDGMFKKGDPTEVLSKARGVRGRPRSD
jgi:hypothetical protein